MKIRLPYALWTLSKYFIIEYKRSYYLERKNFEFLLNILGGIIDDKEHGEDAL